MSDDNSSNNWDNSSSSSSGDEWSGSDGDSFSETSHKSWFEKIMDSLKAILFGLLFVVAGCALLFWNEGNSAKTAAALHEGAGQVVSVSSERADPANEGKLVHVAGETKAANPARDSEIGLNANGLKLSRKVEMYQWKEEQEKETRKKLGGGEETITRYTYKREWSDRPIESSRFRETSGHQNPAMPQTRSRSFAAEGATLGGFRLDAQVISLLGSGDTFDVPASALAGAKKVFGERASVAQGAIYAGNNPDAPVVGDIRVTYTLLPVQPVSVVGKQIQSGFTPFTTSNQRTVLLAETGIKDAAILFKHAEDANKILTWILRLVGVIVLFLGFRMMLSLLEVLADIIPIFGDIVGVGASMVALLATAVVAPVVIAMAWFFYRPVYAGLILAAGAAIFFGLRYLSALRRQPAPAGLSHAQPVPFGGQQGLAGGSIPYGSGAQQAPPPDQFGRRNPQQGVQNPGGQQGGGSFLPPGFGKK